MASNEPLTLGKKCDCYATVYMEGYDLKLMYEGVNLYLYEEQYDDVYFDTKVRFVKDKIMFVLGKDNPALEKSYKTWEVYEFFEVSDEFVLPSLCEDLLNIARKCHETCYDEGIVNEDYRQVMVAVAEITFHYLRKLNKRWKVPTPYKPVIALGFELLKLCVETDSGSPFYPSTKSAAADIFGAVFQLCSSVETDDHLTMDHTENSTFLMLVSFMRKAPDGAETAFSDIGRTYVLLLIDKVEESRLIGIDGCKDFMDTFIHHSVMNYNELRRGDLTRLILAFNKIFTKLNDSGALLNYVKTDVLTNRDEPSFQQRGKWVKDLIIFMADMLSHLESVAEKSDEGFFRYHFKLLGNFTYIVLHTPFLQYYELEGVGDLLCDKIIDMYKLLISIKSKRVDVKLGRTLEHMSFFLREQKFDSAAELSTSDFYRAFLKNKETFSKLKEESDKISFDLDIGFLFI